MASGHAGKDSVETNEGRSCGSREFDVTLAMMMFDKHPPSHSNMPLTVRLGVFDNNVAMSLGKTPRGSLTDVFSCVFN